MVVGVVTGVVKKKLKDELKKKVKDALKEKLKDTFSQPIKKRVGKVKAKLSEAKGFSFKKAVKGRVQRAKDVAGSIGDLEKTKEETLRRLATSTVPPGGRALANVQELNLGLGKKKKKRKDLL